MSKCRICNSPEFKEVIDFGEQPLVNALIEEKDLDKTDPTFPLVVEQCMDCSLVQVVETADPQKIYRDSDYLYFSGEMPKLEEYFIEYAEDLLDRFVGSGDFVVEIGSNDGLMLKEFPIGLGVDPSTNVVVRALANNIPTISDFFTARLARTIKREYGPAKLIYGNNCIAHLLNLQDLMEGVSDLLTDDGIFVVECNYWGGMVDNLNYSLIYHDHFSYFTAMDWLSFAPEYGMTVFDAVVTPAQGGSLRVFMQKGKPNKTRRSYDLMERELNTNLNTYRASEKFRDGVMVKAADLGAQIKTLYAEGKVIAGYGAAAKGFSILSLAGITNEISYFVDDSPTKQGKYTPVNHIPVVARGDRPDPDVFIITAPNYAKIIKQKETNFKGIFIVP